MLSSPKILLSAKTSIAAPIPDAPAVPRAAVTAFCAALSFLFGKRLDARVIAPIGTPISFK